MEGKSSNWQDGEYLGSTVEPGVSMTALEEDIPTLTVATIIGVAMVVLVAIAIVFVLGVLIDCRQQRLLDKKMGEMKRTRRRAPVQDSDDTCIVNNMEESATSLPPAAAALRNVP
ncbi:hypothetical protein MSG28_003466 [Choristoneura fumiferana]|uniref:Uncharacterized protein n=1 Tax=Choristoneura fumiferana TaxID=7141 RepID=A0ACC0KFQ1_CHOFU|nr:hypothetical protein MSG28_003466 [Choristoneura fumiferana]